MLNREVNSLSQAVGEAWARVDREIGAKAVKKQRDIVAKYVTDPRFLKACDELTGFGVLNAEAVLTSWLNSGGISSLGMMGGTVPKFSATGLRADCQKEVAAIVPKMARLGSDEAYGIFNIALNTSTMKWPALQPHVYALMADIASATEYDVIRTAIRTFAGAIK